MFGPYTTDYIDGKKLINYSGNKVFWPVKNIQKIKFSQKILNERLHNIIADKRFSHLHAIDNGIFFATVDFFRKIGAEWCNLPLTTLMISSPGEVYAGKTIDYTTDTLPVDISWFDNKRSIFLSESSQFYLELRLLVENVNKVFSIYNSFRKEKADFCHLSEFQHIEFEGKISSHENIQIGIGLMDYIVQYLVKNNRKDLEYYLSADEVSELPQIFSPSNFKTLTFKEALSVLYMNTGDKKYKKFSMENFGSWEEIRLTELCGTHVVVTEFPMLQIPFYHNVIKHNQDGIPLAENADIILYGFRETIGSGARISDQKALLQKAKIFNLPPKDYEPYLKTRNYKQYKSTAGFGMGWQRFVQWLLKLPYIWESTHIPRGHHLPKP